MKRALLVGINAYPGQPLNGCVNDVEDVAALLTSTFGFAEADIRLLVDGEATAAGIRAGIDWLTAGAQDGDTLYFHYSGHGTQFPIRNHAGRVTENHGAICPVDFDWSRECALLDTDLRALLDKAPGGAEFVYVSDSCNSGDLTLAAGATQPRFLRPPEEVDRSLRAARADGVHPMLLQDHDRCGLISGCRFDQESADAVFGGRYNGALTYYLIRALEDAGGAAPLTALIGTIRGLLRDAGYPQEPQLHGPDAILARPFLGGP